MKENVFRKREREKQDFLIFDHVIDKNTQASGN